MMSPFSFQTGSFPVTAVYLIGIPLMVTCPLVVTVVSILVLSCWALRGRTKTVQTNAIAYILFIVVCFWLYKYNDPFNILIFSDQVFPYFLTIRIGFTTRF